MPRKKVSESTATKRDNNDDQRVKEVVDKFNASWNYCQSNYHSTWSDAWKLYNNKRVKVGYEGYSKIFVPMTFSTIETMVAALAGGKPSFDFIPPKDKPDQSTEVINSLVDSYWDKDQWNIKVQNWVRSMLLYGTGVIHLQWYHDHPVMVNVPLRDFFFDPNAISMENCGESFYAGRRYLTTLDELKTYEVVDLDEKPDAEGNYPMKKKYKNLDDVPAGGHAEGESDKEMKELFYGSTAPDPEKSQVECIELWTEDRTITILNRARLIQDDENEYKRRAKEQYGEDKASGIIPFIVQRDYVDESLFLGRGEVETFADLQEDLNDSRNQKRDYVSYALQPMSRLDPDHMDMADQVQAALGRVLPLKSGDFEWLAMPPVPQGAFEEEQDLKNEIRETTAVDQVVQGVGDDSSPTATEINAQVASAGQRIGMKITQLENEGFHRLARVIFEMVKLYVTEPMQVRVVNNGVKWDTFNPQDFQGDYEPRVQLATSVEAKKEQDVRKAQEMYLALATDPQVNQSELKRMVLPKIYDLDPDEVDRLLTPPEQPMGMDAGMDMGGMGEMGLPDEGPMSDVAIDPVTGELMPMAENPTDQEVMI